MDSYKILNISKTATQDEIKKAFKKLALKWHPDKNLDNIPESEEKFKEISSAYEQINTPEKKQLYDNPPRNPHFIINLNQHPFFNFVNIRNIHKMQPHTRFITKIKIVNGVMTKETIIM